MITEILLAKQIIFGNKRIVEKLFFNGFQLEITPDRSFDRWKWRAEFSALL